MPNDELNQVQSQPQFQPQPTDFNPNYYNPNQVPLAATPTDYSSLQAPEAPYPDSVQGAYQNSYADYSQAAPTGFGDPSQQAYGDYTQQPETISSGEVFEEKKSGNKMVLYGAIGVLVLLIIAAGVLIYLNFFASTSTPAPAQKQTNNSSQTNTTPAKTETKPAAPTINTSLTGGPNSPATKARLFNETKAPSTWLKQKFTAAVIDADGNCIVANVCGDSADSDNDGLSVIEEYNFQSDPQNNDTDNDGIADGDEVFVYNSDPLKADSDSDTYKDGAEIAGCFDPIADEASRMNQTRLSEISTQIGLRPLKEKTKTTLTAANAKDDDISSKGVVSAACGSASSTNPSFGTTTPTTSSTPNTTAPTPNTSTTPAPTGN